MTLKLEYQLPSPIPNKDGPGRPLRRKAISGGGLYLRVGEALPRMRG